MSVAHERQQFHGGGENGFDWIWENPLKAVREESMYVNYIETGDGRHLWLLPLDSEFYIHTYKPEVLQLAKALYDTGCTSAASLQAIADSWREIPIEDALTYEELVNLNKKTLEKLYSLDLLKKDPQDKAYKTIISHWTYPMYSCDLSMDKKNNSKKKIIEQYRSGGYY